MAVSSVETLFGAEVQAEPALGSRVVTRVAFALLFALSLLALSCSPSSASSSGGDDSSDALADGSAEVALDADGDLPSGDGEDDLAESSPECATDEDCQAGSSAGPCGTPTCVLPEGVCVIIAGIDGTACDDANACTKLDQCVAGACRGVEQSCDDANPCTEDSCDPVSGCISGALDGGDCDDANPCTPSSACEAGVCAGESNECICDTDADCAIFDDDDRCNGVLICADSSCAVAEGSVVSCDGSLDTACEKASCDPDVGVCFRIQEPAGSPCNDGDACSTDDVCVNGACKGLSPVDCDDDNPCTTDFCEDGQGCRYVYNSLPCDDGDRCTAGDRCDFGQCLPGPSVCVCEVDADCKVNVGSGPCVGDYACGLDSRCHLEAGTKTECPIAPPGSCVVYSCDNTAGSCVEQAIDDGLPCDDGDVCTKADECQLGVCVGTRAVTCFDGDPCTQDRCQAPYGCLFDQEAAELTACNDGNFCTGGEYCLHGDCYGATSSCECFEDADCAAFDDGNACNGSLLCQNNLCTVDPATIVVCSEIVDNPCVDVACNPGSGLCEPALAPDGSACEDGDACTTNDHCTGGSCAGGEPKACVSTSPCQVGYCHPKAGCVYNFRSGTCSDGDPCTEHDICSSGVCTGSRQRNCEDGDPCTKELCVSGEGCRYDPVPSACDDEDACSFFDVCEAGRCQGGAARHCDDENPCTNDLCAEDGSCEHLPNDLACDDGNGCTSGDTCAEGACVPGAPCVVDSALDCAAYDDGDLCNGVMAYDADSQTCVPDVDSVVVCVDDSTEACVQIACDPADGACKPTPRPEGTACDDQNLCTAQDRCADGVCQGDALKCEDGEICTDDTCDPLAGCQHTANAVACSDGDSCSVFDYCLGGECVPGPKLCDCKDDLDCAVVDDGDRCNGTFMCDDGACVHDPDTVIVCSTTDETDCRVNVCQAATGTCVLKAIADGMRCDDGNPCTLSDVCQDGVCNAGGAVECDDANDCTQDHCDDAGVCQYLPLDGPGFACDDGNPCTGPGASDRCVAGACVGAARVCSDGDACTLDWCDAAAGSESSACQSESVDDGDPCDDEDACTLVSSCQQGVCTASGPPLSCDDGNPCTIDAACDSQTGLCATEDATDGSPCDGFFGACVESAVCVAGKCEPQAVKPCLSEDPCMEGACDPESGDCAFTPKGVGAACALDDPCVITAVCNAGGLCEAAQLKTCPQGTNPCQLTSCDAAQGGLCVPANVADDTDCSSGDLCMDASCVAGVCQAQPKDCADLKTGDEVCQNVWCDPAEGCKVENLEGEPCVYGPCTEGDACDATGACKAGVAKDCSTTNSCQVPIGCDTGSGECIYDVLPDSSSCDDGNPCTENDQCTDGGCAGQWRSCDDGYICTVDFCDPTAAESEACSHILTNTLCDDFESCSLDKCDPEGVDANPITGCVYTLVTDGGSCDDGDACTDSDQCSHLGVCQGMPKLCDDSNPCTDDVCESASGDCAFAANGADIPCEAASGQACMKGDYCQAGLCMEGAYDECVGLSGDAGCAGVPNGSACDDGDPDTYADSCYVGSCFGFRRFTISDVSAITDLTARRDDGSLWASAVISGGPAEVGGLYELKPMGSSATAVTPALLPVAESYRPVRFDYVTQDLLVANEPSKAVSFIMPDAAGTFIEDQVAPIAKQLSGVIGLSVSAGPTTGAYEYLFVGESGLGSPWGTSCRYDYSNIAVTAGNWTCSETPFAQGSFDAGVYGAPSYELNVMDGYVDTITTGNITAMTAFAVGLKRTSPMSHGFFRYDLGTQTWTLSDVIDIAPGPLPTFTTLDMTSASDVAGLPPAGVAAGRVGSLAFYDGTQWAEITALPAGFESLSGDTSVDFTASIIGGIQTLVPGVAFVLGHRKRGSDSKEIFGLSWQVTYDADTSRYVFSNPTAHLFEFPDLRACDGELALDPVIAGSAGDITGGMAIYFVGSTYRDDAGLCQTTSRALAYEAFLIVPE